MCPLLHDKYSEGSAGERMSEIYADIETKHQIIPDAHKREMALAAFLIFILMNIKSSKRNLMIISSISNAITHLRFNTFQIVFSEGASLLNKSPSSTKW